MVGDVTATAPAPQHRFDTMKVGYRESTALKTYQIAAVLWTLLPAGAPVQAAPAQGELPARAIAAVAAISGTI